MLCDKSLCFQIIVQEVPVEVDKVTWFSYNNSYPSQSIFWPLHFIKCNVRGPIIINYSPLGKQERKRWLEDALALHIHHICEQVERITEILFIYFSFQVVTKEVPVEIEKVLNHSQTSSILWQDVYLTLTWTMNWTRLCFEMYLLPSKRLTSHISLLLWLYVSYYLICVRFSGWNMLYSDKCSKIDCSQVVLQETAVPVEKVIVPPKLDTIFLLMELTALVVRSLCEIYPWKSKRWYFLAWRLISTYFWFLLISLLQLVTKEVPVETVWFTTHESCVSETFFLYPLTLFLLFEGGCARSSCGNRKGKLC